MFNFTPARQDFGLFLTRLIAGLIFVVHGYQKFFVQGIDGVTGFFANIGIPLAGTAALLVSTLEFVGGMLLVLGLLTPIVGVLLAMNMLVASLVVHLPNGFYAMDGGYEFPMLLGAVSLALAVMGPGRWAVDALFARNHKGESSAGADRGPRTFMG